MSKNKMDYWDRYKDDTIPEEAFASSGSGRKAFDFGKCAANLYNAVENTDEDETCESDMFVSRKKSDGIAECEEDSKAVCGAMYDTATKLSKKASEGPTKESKPAKEEFDSFAKPVATEKPTETPAAKIFASVPKAKVKEKDLSLDEMENAILQKVPLIRHDGGIYYYNGKTYIAIKNDIDLMELIRRMNVSASCFQTRNVRIFADLFTYFKSDPKLVPCDYEERLNKCRNYVVLGNGVLNVKKLELKPFNKKWLTFHAVNANWVENPNPKRFLKFLNDAAMGDQSIVRLTLEVIGVLLSSLNLKRFFVVGTAPDSGKSTLALLLKELIGEDFVVSIPPNNLGDRFALGSTRGKILNLAMDIPNGKLNATAVSRLKNITGSDAITIEEKYMRSESTVSTLRFLFGTNYPITLPREDDDNAFWERMVIIPFMRSTPPSEIDRGLLDKLLNEKDDIVSLCLQHLHNVIRNNYTFSTCHRGEEMKQSWRRAEFSTASMAYFWNNRVEETGNPEDAVYASALYGEYINYCADNGLDAVSYIQMVEWISKSVDPESCQKKRIHRTGTNPLAGYVGIKLKSN